MSDESERSVASAGSVAVAFAVVFHGYAVDVFLREENAIHAALHRGVVVPLYERPTLTDAEREAVLAMACHCDTRSGLEWVRLSATLRGLLERLGGGK